MGIFGTEPKAQMIDSCERLSDVTKLSAHVTRILGQNPGHTTLQGTNSYFLQPPSDPLAPIILIDTSSPHTAAQYVDLVVSHLHHLGLESGVREVHFESAYAQQSLDLLHAPITGPASGSGPKGKDQDAAEAELKAKRAQAATDAKQAVLNARMENPLVNPLELAEYGGAGWVPAASARQLPPIEHIILTHRHLDHTGAVPLLLRALKSLGLPPPKIWKMPNPDEAALQANSKDRQTTDQALIDQLPKGLYTPFSPFQPLHPILPGLMISILNQKYRSYLKHDKDGRPKWNDVPELARVSVRCLKTPGHTADSISLMMCEGEKGVFAGDAIHGEGSGVCSDVPTYMTSLRTLAALKPAAIYPGHGQAIVTASAAAAHIQSYVTAHNKQAEDIMSLLKELEQPHALSKALTQYFERRNAEAIKRRKDDLEFRTGLPYKASVAQGGRVRKAAYGTLRWVSEKGTAADEIDGKEGPLRPGRYGHGKALPEGFETKGMMRGKDAGVKPKPKLEDDKAEVADVGAGEAAAEETTTATQIKTVDQLIPMPDLSAFDHPHNVPVPADLLARILLDSADDKAIFAAEKSVQAHLDKLEKDGKVKKVTSNLPKIRDLSVGDEIVGEGWELAT